MFIYRSGVILSQENRELTFLLCGQSTEGQHQNSGRQERKICESYVLSILVIW